VLQKVEDGVEAPSHRLARELGEDLGLLGLGLGNARGPCLGQAEKLAHELVEFALLSGDFALRGRGEATQAGDEPRDASG